LGCTLSNTQQRTRNNIRIIRLRIVFMMADNNTNTNNDESCQSGDDFSNYKLWYDVPPPEQVTPNSSHAGVPSDLGHRNLSYYNPGPNACDAVVVGVGVSPAQIAASHVAAANITQQATRLLATLSQQAGADLPPPPPPAPGPVLTKGTDVDLGKNPRYENEYLRLEVSMQTAASDTITFPPRKDRNELHDFSYLSPLSAQEAAANAATMVVVIPYAIFSQVQEGVRWISNLYPLHAFARNLFDIQPLTGVF
jgi:hypothetical protein